MDDYATFADLLVEDVMRRRPSTIGVFLEFRMGCVGCPIGAFHSVEEACRAHGMDEMAVSSRLRAAVSVEA
jgi:hybrid cluster-associated redox disulfide protein